MFVRILAILPNVKWHFAAVLLFDKPAATFLPSPVDKTGARPSQQRIPSLDGLRAISIFMVLFHHSEIARNFPARLLAFPNYLLFFDGLLGVRVFFVISGFLITTLLLKEAQETGKINLKSFYRRRALRILPVYYVYILVVAALDIAGHFGIPLGVFVSSATFTTELWGGWAAVFSWPLKHTWSLSIEEQFYLTWPVMLAFLGVKIPGKLWIPALLFCAPVLRWFFLRDDSTADHFFFLQGDSIACGCLLAILLERRESLMKRCFGFHPSLMRVVSIALIYLNIFLVPIVVHLGFPYPLRLSKAIMPGLQSFSTAYLIGSLTLVRDGFGYSFLNWRPVQWIGRLSYSIYIWQQICLIPASVALFPVNWTVVNWLVQFPQNLLVAFSLAIASYYLLELPMLSLGRRFSHTPATKAYATSG